MKKTGRQIVVFFVMLMVASMTMLSAQAAKPRDLQTELKNFFPGVDNYNQNVWQLYPKKLSKLNVYPQGYPIFEAEVGSRVDRFLVEALVEFDSDFYRQYDPKAPIVKGTFYYIKNDNDSSRTYVAIVNDNRVLDYAKTHLDYKDKYDQPHGSAIQNEYEKVDEMRGESYEFGIPIFKYKDAKGAEVSMEFSPDAIVKIYEIAHPIGNYMEEHTSMLDDVRVGALDKTIPFVVKIVKEFSNDFFSPISITFVFKDKKKEFYNLYKTSTGSCLLVSRDFLVNWQP